MTSIIDWPCSLLRPLNTTYFLNHKSRSAGMSLAGSEQIVSSGISRWEVTLDLPREFNRDLVRAFEVAVTEMEGRRNIAALCVCDPFKYGAARSPQQQAFKDGTWFSDGTGWVNGTAVAPMVVTAGVSAGGNELTVNLSMPKIPSLMPGDYFSHAGFLYRVLGKTAGGWVRFAPRARKPIPVGAILKTNPPQFYGRFADDEQGRRARDYLRWGAQTSITFIEAFDR